MPSAITHYIFGKQAIENLKTPLPFLKNDEYKEVCLVGCQGPDPLFFYGMNPFVKRKNAKEVQAMGTYLHEHKMAKKFSDMIDYANNQNGNQKDVLYAYIFGAMMHYCLDRVAHPFIFYRSGFKLEGKPDRNYPRDHALYEAYIDRLMQMNFGLKLKGKKCVKANKTLMSLVSAMYAYNEKLESDSFLIAWKDMYAIEGLLYDPHGIKKWFLEKLNMENTMQYGMICPKDNDLKLDFLNLNREAFKNPQTLEKSQHSFIELYNIALNDVKNIVKILKMAYNNTVVEDDLIKYCEDITYDGTKEDSEMREFESILLK